MSTRWSSGISTSESGPTSPSSKGKASLGQGLSAERQLVQAQHLQTQLTSLTVPI